MLPVKCSHCKEVLGYGDPYDLLKAHLWHCPSKAALNVIKAREEETQGHPWELGEL